MSTRIKSGETAILRVPTNIDMSAVSSVIFTLIGRRKFTKTYPNDVSYANGEFLIPLTQQNTIDLEGTYRIQGQVNYGNKSVLITDTIEGCIEPSLSSKIISGNTPSTNIPTPILTLQGTVIVVNNGGSQYSLPVANSTTLGGVRPIIKTAEMTQSVGVDATGKLYTAPNSFYIYDETTGQKYKLGINNGLLFYEEVEG